MAGLGDLVKNAFYLGVGLAAHAGEKAGESFADLRDRAQQVADEMVQKGEMSTEEARKFVNDMLKKAREEKAAEKSAAAQKEEQTPQEPRRIEILDDEREKPQGDVDDMRRQVKDLEEELRRLKKD